MYILRTLLFNFTTMNYELTPGTKFTDWDGKRYYVIDEDLVENIATGGLFALHSFDTEELDVTEWGEQDDKEDCCGHDDYLDT